MANIQTECFPVCRACKERGSCDKVWAESKPSPLSELFQAKPRYGEWVGTPQPAPTKFPVNGSTTPGYFQLECECWTAREEQRPIDLWRPSADKFWCNLHNKWQKMKRGPKNDVKENSDQTTIPF